ncbi:hypothetical protein FOA24_22960 [Bacillus thuringiensis]|uniref:hypothetical protein n=1 Tax=Bacillus thuringiensis TaxID=1428 RepID=UPI0033378C9F
MNRIENIEANGGLLLERQMMYSISAMEILEGFYMNKEQLELLKFVYEKKIQNPNKVITLSKKEVSIIGTDDKGRLEESKASFEQINITWEF